MSTRAQVHFKNSGVFLYQHMDGANLPIEVANALLLNERWDDEDYLARIVFDTMKDQSNYPTTGYGIGTVEHGDIEYLVVLDVENQTVEVKTWLLDNLVSVWAGSFSDFISLGQQQLESF